ncbi:hypothetical protein RclHR1_01390006 [Rhizophagus clarus]|uniref:Uncharacterized protein n=1 Tax=Rhizophagus clarus TaxID=94130 RepID=A0A2Z6R3R1_9GLOM|nr:hypothetical protein RclHR1_01390006 [Rhizophagus clarus]GET04886.1 hypothetical protein GLOIN_2v1474275 [Rhizophagus clarus]
MTITADSYRENFNILKEKTSAIDKRLKNENKEYEKLIERIILNTCNNGAETVQPLGTNFNRISGIMEDKDKIIGDTHKLTDKVIDSLKSKEIYCLRDWITKFFTQVEGRYNAPNNDVRGWAKLLGAFDQKTSYEMANFRSRDKEYISQLKITLNEVQMSTDDFEKLYKMKRESNIEFHDQTDTLPEAEERFEKMQFTDEMKHYKEPLKKLFEALKIWYRD